MLLFTKQGGLWLGMTGGLSTQVKMNVKPIGAFKSGLIRQVAFERRGLKIQGPLYIILKKAEMNRYVGTLSMDYDCLIITGCIIELTVKWNCS